MACSAYGFCGMPCGLCPYYHTNGKSRCVGCSHDGFFTGACGIFKCCKNKRLIHCALCDEYPCKKCVSLKEFASLNTDGVWFRTASLIKSVGFDEWFNQYQRKVNLLEFALEHYNNGKMKRWLCELFINNDINKLELIMDKASLLTGSRKDICLGFKKIVEQL